MRNERRFLNHPLALCPELSVLCFPGYQEYRLTNKELNFRVILWPSLTVPLVVICFRVLCKNYCCLLIVLFLILIASLAFAQPLFESVILLPPHGIQLEVHYGFPGLNSFTCSKQFIPSAALEGAFMNEGLKGWNVLYFLTVVQRTSSGFEFRLAYKNLLPSALILLETLEGIHRTIQSGNYKGKSNQ